MVAHKWRLLARGLAVLAAVLMVVAVGAADAQENADDPAKVEEGKAVFEQNCARCHAEDGAGTTRGRPLIDIAAEQPDRSVHIMSVTEGKGFMPAWGEDLTAEEIDAVVSYVRLEFSSAEPAAVAEELAATGSGTDNGLIVATALIGTGVLLVAISRRRLLSA